MKAIIRIFTLLFTSSSLLMAEKFEPNCGHEAIIGFFELDNYEYKNDGKILEALENRFPYKSSTIMLQKEIIERGNELDAPIKLDYRDNRAVFSLACTKKGKDSRSVSKILFYFDSAHRLEKIETEFNTVEDPESKN